MSNAFTTKLKKKQHDIMLNIHSVDHWKPAVETCVQEMNREPGNELGGTERRAEQFPHLGNYTLTDSSSWQCYRPSSFPHSAVEWPLIRLSSVSVIDSAHREVLRLIKTTNDALLSIAKSVNHKRRSSSSIAVSLLPITSRFSIRSLLE